MALHEFLNLLLPIAFVSIVLYVIIASSPVFAVLGLIAAILCFSAMLLMLGCEFLALLYVMVYIGAVMILFLWVVMTIPTKKEFFFAFSLVELLILFAFCTLLILTIIYWLLVSPTAYFQSLPGTIKTSSNSFDTALYNFSLYKEFNRNFVAKGGAAFLAEHYLAVWSKDNSVCYLVGPTIGPKIPTMPILPVFTAEDSQTVTPVAESAAKSVSRFVHWFFRFRDPRPRQPELAYLITFLYSFFYTLSTPLLADQVYRPVYTSVHSDFSLNMSRIYAYYTVFHLMTGLLDSADSYLKMELDLDKLIDKLMAMPNVKPDRRLFAAAALASEWWQYSSDAFSTFNPRYVDYHKLFNPTNMLLYRHSWITPGTDIFSLLTSNINLTFNEANNANGDHIAYVGGAYLDVLETKRVLLKPRDIYPWGRWSTRLLGGFVSPNKDTVSEYPAWWHDGVETLKKLRTKELRGYYIYSSAVRVEYDLYEEIIRGTKSQDTQVLSREQYCAKCIGMPYLQGEAFRNRVLTRYLFEGFGPPRFHCPACFNPETYITVPRIMRKGPWQASFSSSNVVDSYMRLSISTFNKVGTKMPGESWIIKPIFVNLPEYKFYADIDWVGILNEHPTWPKMGGAHVGKILYQHLSVELVIIGAILVVATIASVILIRLQTSDVFEYAEYKYKF